MVPILTSLWTLNSMLFVHFYNIIMLNENLFCIISHTKTRITCSGSSSADGEGCCLLSACVHAFFYTFLWFDSLPSLPLIMTTEEYVPCTLFLLYSICCFCMLYYFMYLLETWKSAHWYWSGYSCWSGNWEKVLKREQRTVKFTHCCCWSGKIDIQYIHTYTQAKYKYLGLSCWYHLVLYILACVIL